MGIVWRWLGLLLLVVSGCRSTGPELEPPPQPEEYTLPPENDSRFNKPPQLQRDPLSPTPGKRTAPLGQPVVPARSPRSGFGPGMY